MAMANLRNRVETWVLVKVLLTAFERLESQHVGTKIGDALDHRFSQTDSQVIQTKLATWLHAVANELAA